MPELTQEEKIKTFEKLPKELRELMESENTGAFLLYLGGKYNLNDEKISSLSKIVGDVILGITPLPNLTSEIVSKLAIDTSAASQVAQEINAELLAPVANLLKSTVPVPAIPTPPPPPVAKPQIPETKYQVPSADHYREPAGPEIIDLRKTPMPPMPMPVAPAPIPPSPPKPLTFTKPIERPLIEAEPHRTPAPVPTPQPSTPPVTALPRPPAVSRVEPQYIIRPPGLSPTDLPHDVLDLRKDKGEF